MVFVVDHSKKIVVSQWSEWRDLNPRPLGPKPSAIPGYATLRHANTVYRCNSKNQDKYLILFGNLYKNHYKVPIGGLCWFVLVIK